MRGTQLDIVSIVYLIGSTYVIEANRTFSTSRYIPEKKSIVVRCACFSTRHPHLWQFLIWSVQVSKGIYNQKHLPVLPKQGTNSLAKGNHEKYKAIKRISAGNSCTMIKEDGTIGREWREEMWKKNRRYKNTQCSFVSFLFAAHKLSKPFN